ncbi:MAG TPA: YncE family protein [Stellaceae bacterium]|nr:YncE family protein [Stellaceae bacterium]
MSNTLRHIGYVELPEHIGAGGFDHAAVHTPTGHVFVAHTANDAVEVFHSALGKPLYSIANLKKVAGVLVNDEAELVITSNRGENTIGIFAPGAHFHMVKVPVGLRPNGLAYDPLRRLILVANVGDPSVPGSPTLSIVGLDDRAVLADIPVPGRTRWAIYDPDSEAFYVNIAEPAQIIVVAAREPHRVARALAVPAAGPHGLDLDLETHRLYCACDAKMLVALDVQSGKVLGECTLSGAPDVIFLNPARRHLYVAIGDPGVIDVLDTVTLQRLESVPTEEGAHTLAFAPTGDRVYAFLPETHRAAVYQEIEE